VPTKLRIISAPPAVLCPPPRAFHPPLSPTNNLRVWCEENGELGERILEEWDDPEMGPEEVTRGSKYRARWKCRECGRTFHAQVGARTSVTTSGPTGCKSLHLVATETHNLKNFCDESGGAARAPAGGVEPPQQEDGGLHTRLSRDCAVEVREVRVGVERHDIQPHYERWPQGVPGVQSRRQTQEETDRALAG
jgi:hypothetical protein